MRAEFLKAKAALDALLEDSALLGACERAGDRLIRCLSSGGKILLCGNGGSACDAAHFAEELTGRYRAAPPGGEDRPPLAAIACTDGPHITCTANDYGFEEVFSRWVRALGRPGDALIVLSTSGNSPNLLAAARAARAGELGVIALLGRGGGALAKEVDESLVMPAAAAGSERIQELHMLILHAWVERIERVMFGRS